MAEPANQVDSLRVTVGLGGERGTTEIPLTEEFRRAFKLERLLGAGAMGAVYAARQASTGRAVAIKFLIRLDNAVVLKRFQEETRLLASLTHPNVVSVLDAGTVSGHPYLVAERLEGGTLRDRLMPGEPLAADQAVLITRQMLAGLGACHAAGIIHRDVKPENVLFDAGGTLKLVDLGIARHYEQGGDRLTQAGAVMGTPRYMPPEQFTGEPPSPATDLYAVGLILYEMLYGDVPLMGKGTLPEIFVARTNGTLELPASPPVPAHLGALLTSLVVVEPGRRPQSAQDVDRLLDAMGRVSRRTAVPGSAPPRRVTRPPVEPVMTMAAPAAALVALPGGATGPGPVTARAPAAPAAARAQSGGVPVPARVAPRPSGPVPVPGAVAGAAPALSAGLAVSLVLTGFALGWFARGASTPPPPVVALASPASASPEPSPADAEVAPESAPDTPEPPASARPGPGGRKGRRSRPVVTPRRVVELIASVQTSGSPSPAASAAPPPATPAAPPPTPEVAHASPAPVAPPVLPATPIGPAVRPGAPLTELGRTVVGWLQSQEFPTLVLVPETAGTDDAPIVLCLAEPRHDVPSGSRQAFKLEVTVSEAPPPTYVLHFDQGGRFVGLKPGAAGAPGSYVIEALPGAQMRVDGGDPVPLPQAVATVARNETQRGVPPPITQQSVEDVVGALSRLASFSRTVHGRVAVVRSLNTVGVREQGTRTAQPEAAGPPPLPALPPRARLHAVAARLRKLAAPAPPSAPDAAIPDPGDASPPAPSPDPQPPGLIQPTGPMRPVPARDGTMYFYSPTDGWMKQTGQGMERVQHDALPPGIRDHFPQERFPDGPAR